VMNKQIKLVSEQNTHDGNSEDDVNDSANKFNLKSNKESLKAFDNRNSGDTNRTESFRFGGKSKFVPKRTVTSQDSSDDDTFDQHGSNK